MFCSIIVNFIEQSKRQPVNIHTETYDLDSLKQQGLVGMCSTKNANNIQNWKPTANFVDQTCTELSHSVNISVLFSEYFS